MSDELQEGFVGFFGSRFFGVSQTLAVSCRRVWHHAGYRVSVGGILYSFAIAGVLGVLHGNSAVRCKVLLQLFGRGSSELVHVASAANFGPLPAPVDWDRSAVVDWWSFYFKHVI